MDKTVVIGTGFSGLITALILGDLVEIYSANKPFRTPFYKKRSFIFNKLLGAKAFSSTRLNNGLLRASLHDRLIHGGNGTIWGGFINIEKVPVSELSLLQKSGITLAPLSFKITGSASNNESIYQLQSPIGRVLDPGILIRNYKEAFLETFEVMQDGTLNLRFLIESHDGLREDSVHVGGHLILALGVVQLIDLLYRSGYLKEGDYLELTEFKYHFGLTLRSRGKDDASQKIKFNLVRGLLHYLGIQTYPNLLSALDNFLPFIFQQTFFNKKLTHQFFIKNETLIDGAIIPGEKFGSSIHYFGLKINGVLIDDFLKRISPNIIGLGMACVDQKTPGPICNDILSDSLKKINYEK